MVFLKMESDELVQWKADGNSGGEALKGEDKE